MEKISGIQEDNNWIVDLKGNKIKQTTITDLKKTFEQYLSEKINPSNNEINDETKLTIINFLSQLYDNDTEVKIFKKIKHRC